jgi:DNA-directed RNA polymerases I and III subunit RPAC1
MENAFSMEAFKKGFRIEIISLSEAETEFDLVGADAAIANTFRRILMAEVRGCVRVCMRV